jgi:hypothetical protein
MICMIRLHGMAYVVRSGSLWMVNAEERQTLESSFYLTQSTGEDWFQGVATTFENSICNIMAQGRISCTDIVTGISTQLGSITSFAGARAMTAFNSLLYILHFSGTLWQVDPYATEITPLQIGTEMYWWGTIVLTSGRDGIYTVRPSDAVCRIETIPSLPSACTYITSQTFTNVLAITSILGSIYLAADQTLYRIPLDTGVAVALDAPGSWQSISAMTNLNGYLYVSNDGTLYEVARTSYASSRVMGRKHQWGDIWALAAFSDRSLWYDYGVKFSYKFGSLSYTTGISANNATTGGGGMINQITRSTSYIVNANVSFTCFASNPTSLYLDLTIMSLDVNINGATVPANITADQFAIANSLVVVQARNGTVLHIYANVNESTEAINFKRTLASLLNSYTGVRTDVIDPSPQTFALSSTKSSKTRSINEVDATGTYRAQYTMEQLPSVGSYRWTRSKHDFNHYHPTAQTRIRVNQNGQPSSDNYDDEGEITIDRIDDCTTLIIDGLINTRSCHMNTSILGDSSPLPDGITEYQTKGRVGGNSSVSFKLDKIITLGCEDVNDIHYSECLHSMHGYQQLRIEFEPVAAGTGYHSRASRAACDDKYASQSPLIRQVLAHGAYDGCYDRMSCVRLLPEVLSSLRNDKHDASSLLRDIQFVSGNGLSRSSASFDTGATYRTLLSALVTHGSEVSQQVLIHEFQNGASQLGGRDHILLSFIHLKQPSINWAKQLQSAYVAGFSTAALSLGLLVDRTGHQQSRQFLLQQHQSTMKQLHPFGTGNGTSRPYGSYDAYDEDDMDHSKGHDEKLVSKASLLTHSLANIATHSDWSWLHATASSTSSSLRKTCKQIIHRFDPSMSPSLKAINEKLTSSLPPTPKVTTIINDDYRHLSSNPHEGISLPFNASAKFTRSVGNDRAGLILDAQYSILAGIDQYLTLEASTDNFVHFDAHLFDQELNIIDAWATFDIRSFENSIALVLGHGTKYEKTIFKQELPCIACIFSCSGPRGEFGSGQREIFTFTSTILVGPIPIDLSVGLWAGYHFNYQLQFCLLARPPGIILSHSYPLLNTRYFILI